ncbi:MAG: hypothetical protein DWQ31_19715 [Planctomycetota bacterium]|nr:MAG: hypothetical protein DWQ31_19715 [Planctomycetota bacterium]REJ93762.1 MAG: hypothetical protein DWQ35_09720 [Planctomycetota bacterium]
MVETKIQILSAIGPYENAIRFVTYAMTRRWGRLVVATQWFFTVLMLVATPCRVVFATVLVMVRVVVVNHHRTAITCRIGGVRMMPMATEHGMSSHHEYHRNRRKNAHNSRPI